jgi:YD repeat-containing protein
LQGKTVPQAGGNAARNPCCTAFGNLLQTTDPLGNVVTVIYDNLGRKTDLFDPDLGWIHYAIDPLGRQYQQVNPNERAANPTQATTFVHDLLDRLTQRSEPDLTSYWTYDQLSGACGSSHSCGKLVEAYTWNGPISTGYKDYDRLETYDTLSRPNSTVTTLHNNTAYTSASSYDSYGRLSTITHQPGSSAAVKTFAQYYNGNGYLAQVARLDPVSGTQKVLWQANAQDAADRVTLAALGNGLAIDREYNAYTARLGDATLTNSASVQVLHEGYSYDVLGNVKTRTQYWNTSQNGFSENFQYDNMNRLWTSQVTTNISAPQQTFTYDSIGDIVSKTGAGTGNYVYPGSGANAVQPHAVSSIPGIGSFSYDANGNMLTDAGRSTSWNSFDMPITIAEGGRGEKRTDPLGRVVRTSGNGVSGWAGSLCSPWIALNGVRGATEQPTHLVLRCTAICRIMTLGGQHYAHTHLYRPSRSPNQHRSAFDAQACR